MGHCIRRPGRSPRHGGDGTVSVAARACDAEWESSWRPGGSASPWSLSQKLLPAPVGAAPALSNPASEILVSSADADPGNSRSGETGEAAGGCSATSVSVGLALISLPSIRDAIRSASSCISSSLMGWHSFPVGESPSSLRPRVSPSGWPWISWIRSSSMQRSPRGLYHVQSATDRLGGGADPAHAPPPLSEWRQVRVRLGTPT